MATNKPKENGETTAVPLACVVCRERHLKCDGRQPSCSRCVDSKQNCHYVQSRRGHRPAKKRQRPEETADKVENGSLQGSSVGSPEDYQPQFYNGRSPNGAAAPQVVLDGSASVSREKLRELYYYYFHDAHPIMIPRAYFPRIPVNSIPPAVEAIMDYVGSQYNAKAKQDPRYLARLEACVFGPGARQDAYTVQALTLLGIVYRAQDLNEAACNTFSAAIELAKHLGMHQARFAQLNNGGDPIIGEMWRRVWWELYVNELLLAAFRHEISSGVTNIEGMDVELPWEESNYRNCQPAISRSIYDYDHTTFFEDDDDNMFSSFAYRIVAARQIGRLLALNQPFCPESNDIVNSIDIALNNWMLHLPEPKQTPLGKDGKMDEMMFQAHMMVNAASICLHRPRSDLVFTDVQDSNNCLESRSYGVPATKFSVHTVKCTTAADKIAELITYPGDSLQHTPLFTCMLTLSAVVHLSAYALAHDMAARAAIRERLALSVGSLKTIKGQWVLAGSVLMQIKGAAREVMSAAAAKSIPRPNSGNSDRAYSTDSSINSDPWVVTAHDPLFMQIPDLMPVQEQLPLSAMPDPARMPQAMPPVQYAR